MKPTDRRGPGRPVGSRASIAHELGAAFLSLAAEVCPVDDGSSWPSAKYRDDPVGFAREVLGLELADYQVEILEAIRDNRRTAVSSGRKIGKSILAAIAALWFYSSFPDARVFMTASTASQVTQIIWREIRKLHGKAKIPLSGEPRQHAGSGLNAADGRQILGFANATREDAAGISGQNMLYIFDEATGIEDFIFEAAEGNQAVKGGVQRTFMISNPTRCEGEFYSAFHAKAAFYKTFQISTERSPFVDPEWIAEKVLMYGRESPWFKIHVLGQFVEGEQGRILTMHQILVATQRHVDTPGEGPLVIGIDPAGEGAGGDESTFACRRGRKLLQIYGHTGLSAEEHLTHLRAYISEHVPNRSERATAVVDIEGPIGWKVYTVLRAASQEPGARFSVVGVRASDKARRARQNYELVRDELWAAAEKWIEQEGGAIPEHVKLQQDLHAPSWNGNTRNRLFVTPKTELRKMLGRSTDYGDALCLACWVDGETRGADEVAKESVVVHEPVNESPDLWDAALDPYPRVA